MHKRLIAILAAVLATGALVTTGCGTRAAAEGKLQIMYSGNIRGNVSPCG